jgi:hypothetical protein
MRAEEAFRRAGDRRRFNRLRQETGLRRRAKVAQLLRDVGIGRGVQAAVARTLRASEATVSRDVAGLIRPLDPKPTEQQITIRQEDDVPEVRP